MRRRLSDAHQMYPGVNAVGLRAAGCERPRVAIPAATPCSGLMPGRRAAATRLRRLCAAHGARLSVCGERVARLARLSPGRRPGIQPKVGEDLADRCPLQDRRDDLQLPGAAARAAPQVDVEAGRLGIVPSRGWRHGGMPWPLLRVAGVFVPMLRELSRMAYLWSVPHRRIQVNAAGQVELELKTPCARGAAAGR